MGHHHQGGRPGKDVHHGDHGKDEAPRRSFSKQFKAEAVDLVRQPGNTPASVARDLDLTESAVRGWVHQAEIDGGGRERLTSAEREELSRLRKENRVLREERDILKRATAFFARETR
jgi:transposase